MASCNAETRSCKDEEERKSSSERHGPLSKVNVIDCNYTDKTSLMRNASLDGDMNVDPSTNNSLGSDVTELQCDLKSNCSQTKKGKKRKKRPQIKQNGQIDRQGDGSSIKDDSIGTNSCNERGVDTNMKTDLQKLPKLSRSQKKRMRKKQKLNATVISNKAHGPCGELDLVKGGKMLKSQVIPQEIQAAPCSELSRSQKKRMRKKQKLNATVINNKARGSLAELDLVKVRENDEKLSDSPRNPSTDLNKKHDNDKHGLVETIVDINKRAAPFSELSRSQKKRTRKKQKLNANVINNEAYDSFAELDSIKAAPFSELSQSQKKRMRKKQKLKATVINNKAHGSLAELDSVKVGENDEKLSDSPRNPSTDLNKKHDNDGKPGLVESIVDINKLNPTVINNKAHGSLAELDSIKVGENAEKLIGSSRNPSADFKKKHYNDGKPGLVESIVDINKKEGPLSELSRSQKKK
ncbi:hypothetical protein GH714_043843 [Hevea brasiliensis]|uniref:Uncharacterized protein n=1 Tax=Hevea brasiliensis TaxID=3981 RepID=A0A6A6K1C7_HEVBR|nr:hypothetical protein GH714_043843 [Hevea brasiliensis]